MNTVSEAVLKTRKSLDKEAISELSLSESLDRLFDALLDREGFDRNLPHLLRHIQSLLLAEGRVPFKKRGETCQGIDKISVDLQASFRETAKSLASKDGVFFERMWSCPELSAFLLSSDLRSNTFSWLAQRYPNGHPELHTHHERHQYAKFDTEHDTSGEWLGCLLVQMLVFSCVKPQANNSDIEADGLGELRETPYAAAAWNRLVDIMTQQDWYGSLKESLFPLPSLVLNVAKNRPANFVKCLEGGALPYLLSCSDQKSAHEVLKLIPSFSTLSSNTKLEIIAECGRFLQNPAHEPSKEVVVTCVGLISTMAAQVGSDVACSNPTVPLRTVWDFFTDRTAGILPSFAKHATELASGKFEDHVWTWLKSAKSK